MPGGRVLPPRPPGPDFQGPRRGAVTWEYAGWKVLNWRLYDDYVWAFSLLQPNGSRYEHQPIIGTIEKRPFEDFYTVDAGGVAQAKNEVKNMIETIIRLKGPGVQDTIEVRRMVGRKVYKTTVPKFGGVSQMEDPPDTSWMEMETIGANYGKFGRKDKSLWQEWRDKRAAKKAKKSETVDGERED